ncbi:MAG: hypothetical protein QRY16_01185 [Enterobacterales bacterium endosymbiont of Blomia tropicalis]|nr:hypothetical protein [Mixta mediterraneensis]MDL4912440.1 hypothetical protein [Mixta mediterraneensis]
MDFSRQGWAITLLPTVFFYRREKAIADLIGFRILLRHEHLAIIAFS